MRQGGQFRVVPVLAACLAMAFGGCTQTIREFAKAPELSPVGQGLKSDLPVILAEPLRPVSYKRSEPNSLWTDRAADLFKDRRARRVGDVITVLIKVQDRAALDNSSQRSREGTHNLGWDLSQAIDWMGLSTSGTGSVSSDLSSGTEHQGKGKVARSETIDLRIAVVVRGVLPNGNLLVQGSQELRVNYELRVLSISGLVDVRDVKPDNTVTYDRIAEARMSYGGRGRISEVQQPGWGQQLLDRIAPF